MNEGAAIVYQGNSRLEEGGMYMGQDRRAPRQYPLEVLQVMGGVSRAGGSTHGTPRRWHNRRERQPKDTAFGYDSDDSSLSSNASGSNKSSDKGEGGRGERERERGLVTVTREWRGRGRREQRPRRAVPERCLPAAYPFQVKYAPDDLLNGTKWDPLTQEIWDKFVTCQQTEETFKNKMNLWRYLYISIKSIFPRYGLYVVGSTMSGFGLDSSDMDLCLYVRPAGDLQPRSHALLHLNYILNYIKTFDPDAEVIQAKVPILKFRDERNGVQIDLNCNNVVGIRNTNLLFCYSRMDWRVRPLVAVAKLWASAHRINDARRRTLSSYALTLMVLHFLQCGTTPGVLGRVGEAARGRSQNRTTLAELFLALLKYYAEFPYDQMAISVRLGRRVPLWECRTRAAASPHDDPAHWKLLCVEEPFDLTNAAHSVYDPDTFERIVETFRDSAARLAATLRLRDAWPAQR